MELDQNANQYQQHSTPCIPVQHPLYIPANVAHPRKPLHNPYTPHGAPKHPSTARPIANPEQSLSIFIRTEYTRSCKQLALPPNLNQPFPSHAPTVLLEILSPGDWELRISRRVVNVHPPSPSEASAQKHYHGSCPSCRGMLQRKNGTHHYNKPRCRLTYIARLFQPDCGALEASADNLAWKACFCSCANTVKKSPRMRVILPKFLQPHTLNQDWKLAMNIIPMMNRPKRQVLCYHGSQVG